MVKVRGYELPDDLYYHKEYAWVRVKGKVARVGMIEWAAKAAGEISYVEMPFEGDEVKQGDEVGTLETGKWVGKLHSPVSGTVKAVNEKLYDDPTLINKDPYGEGWIFEVELKDEAELKNLMKPNEAAKWLEEEIKKHE